MAAQEYYNPGATAPRPAGPYDGSAPTYPQAPQRSSSYPVPSTPSGPPPPYSFQSHTPPQYPPRPQHAAPQSQYPPEKQQPYPQQQRDAQYYGQSQGQYQYAGAPNQYHPQQQYMAAAPYGANPAGQYQQPRPAETGSLRPQPYGYPLDYQRTHSQPPRPTTHHHDSGSRSRSGSRHRHHHHHSGNSNGGTQKGSIDTFVGAGGGAIIGDLIFPGLGTVGGALLGGLGGHKVAQDKRRRSDAEREARRSRSTGHYADDDRRGRY